jgi:hypothetical protein
MTNELNNNGKNDDDEAPPFPRQPRRLPDDAAPDRSSASASYTPSSPGSTADGDSDNY